MPSDAYKDFIIIRKRMDKYVSSIKEEKDTLAQTEARHLYEKIQTLSQKMTREERVEVNMYLKDIKVDICM
jgi:hypothetical protein